MGAEGAIRWYVEFEGVRRIEERRGQKMKIWLVGREGATAGGARSKSFIFEIVNSNGSSLGEDLFGFGAAHRNFRVRFRGDVSLIIKFDQAHFRSNLLFQTCRTITIWRH